MASNKPIIAFDLYGTLLSTESIADELAKVVGQEHAQAVAALWRRYQLEYTWRINSMDDYRPFSEITRGALKHAVAESRLALAQGDEDRLMKAYDALRAFPDVRGALASTEEAVYYIFSNGTADMMSASVARCPDLGPSVVEDFAGFVSVDDVRVFKPHRRTYEHLVRRAREEAGAGPVWLVSSNPFDVVGARAAGLGAVWVDRRRSGWHDRLGSVVGGLEPSLVVHGVDEAVREIIVWGKKA